MRPAAVAKALRASHRPIPDPSALAIQSICALSIASARTVWNLFGATPRYVSRAGGSVWRNRLKPHQEVVHA